MDADDDDAAAILVVVPLGGLLGRVHAQQAGQESSPLGRRRTTCY